MAELEDATMSAGTPATPPPGGWPPAEPPENCPKCGSQPMNPYWGLGDYACGSWTEDDGFRQSPKCEARASRGHIRQLGGELANYEAENAQLKAENRRLRRELTLAWSGPNVRVAELEAEINRLKAELANQQNISQALKAAGDIAVAIGKRAEAALPDPDKLETLARWFDRYDAGLGLIGQTGVQTDLRRWAKLAREALSKEGVP